MTYDDYNRLDELSVKMSEIKVSLKDADSRLFEVRSARETLMEGLAVAVNEGGEASHIREDLFSLVRKEAVLEKEADALLDEKIDLAQAYREFSEGLLKQAGEDQ